jgi:dTDP-4-amino-4,6-dideoxygalactose transaminase
MVKIGVLISGSGSNLQAIIDAVEQGRINGELVLVISNDPDAYGLVRAANHRIPTAVLVHTEYVSREAYDRALVDALQAAVLNARLPLLDEDNERRRAIAAIYRGQLEGHGDIRFLDDLESDECVFHQMTILHPRRDALRDHLAAAGVGTAIHYPRALHQQGALASASDGVEAPVAEAAARRALCLPMFPDLGDDEVDYVCEQVLSFGS